MKNIAKLIIGLGCALLISACSPNKNSLTGAGSSFVYPVLAVWAQDYSAKQGIQVNYQAIGSGGGLQQMYSGTVNFAASDMPLTMAQLQQHKLRQFPIVIGGIVVVVNVAGVENNQMILNGSVLADIYLGKVTFWDDAVIKHLNPNLKLPHQNIVTVHRADGAGTTFNFTHYLADVSPVWKKTAGVNTMMSWSNGIGAKGNAGVAAQVLQTPNSIGYVEYAYAAQNHMTVTRFVNAAQQTVTASAASFAAAAKNANWTAENGFYQILTNQPGADSWPIVATTFILMPTAPDAQLKMRLVNFFTWCYENGATAANSLDYVAIPASVYKEIVLTFK
jgi:phosphate transport system substrate-binding protein